MKEVNRMAKDKLSITYTALIWTGIVLMLFGAITAILGFGGSTFFEASFGDLKVKTNQIGLAILIIGAVFTATIARKLPKGVKILGEGVEKYSFTEKLARKIPIFSLAIIVVAIILLVLSFS